MKKINIVNSKTNTKGCKQKNMISIHAGIQDLNFLSYENMCACKSICPAPAFRYLEVNFRYLETGVMGSYEPLRSVMAMEPRFSARTANTLNC